MLGHAGPIGEHLANLYFAMCERGWIDRFIGAWLEVLAMIAGVKADRLLDVGNSQIVIVM